MIPGQKKTAGGGCRKRGGGLMGAISVWTFTAKLWLCDPFAECRKAGEGRRAAECEISGISWVEHQRMILQANSEGVRTARMNLPPPHLDRQFEIPARFLWSPAATPASRSRPSPPSSDGGGDDGKANNGDMDNSGVMEKMPSGGGGGSCVRGCRGGGEGSHSGVGGSRGGWHRGGRQRVRW